MSEKILRVAQLMRSASRNNAGVFVAASGLSSRLAEHVDIELEVFAARDVHNDVDRAQWKGIPVHTFPVLPPSVFGYAPGLEKAVRNFRPQIVHQHGLWSFPSLIARRLSRKKLAHVVVSTHGMLTPWALQRSAIRKKVALLFYESNNLASAGCIHALTPIEVGEVRAIGIRTPICLIPNGVEIPDLTSYKGGREKMSGSRELLYVGRLHEIKGIYELLQGWARYKAIPRKNDWRLKIVGWGDDKYTDMLKSTVAELGINSSVFFTGPRFEEDLLEAYAQADAFVLTSHSEAMPMSVLEAWASGLPVIMTADCGLSEGFVKGAAIRTSVAPQDIAKAIQNLVDMSHDARLEMGRNGRSLVEEFYSWETAAQSFVGVYSWLAGYGSMPECVIL